MRWLGGVWCVFKKGMSGLEGGGEEKLHHYMIFVISRVDKQRNEPGRWKSHIVAIFLLFLTLLHVLT